MHFDRPLLLAAALLGLIGVAAGTFGAHGLDEQVTPELLEIFETGVRYNLIHAVAMLAIAALTGSTPNRLLRAAGWCMAGGTIVFAGSLYMLVLTDLRWFGMVAAVGGIGLMGGWGLLVAVAAMPR